MRRRLRGFWGAQGGAAAVEFAAVLTPLMLMIFGVEEFGRLCWTREALQETATAAARCMAMSSTSCASGGSYSSDSTNTYIEAQATNWGLTLTTSNITLTRSTATTCGGVSATKGFSNVSLTYNFVSAIPHLSTGVQGGEALTTTSCFPNYS
jgi:Flp pilus assembly protein TadG